MPTAIYEILEETSKKKSEKEKIEYLQTHADNNVLKTVLAGAYYPGIKWNLPPGSPPYKLCDPVNAESFLYGEARRLYIFCEGGPEMSNVKRESLFIELLESIHPKDAEVILAMKDKKLPYKGVTPTLINKAFPGLIDEEVQEV
jgi:hypothetical protein